MALALPLVKDRSGHPGVTKPGSAHLICIMIPREGSTWLREIPITITSDRDSIAPTCMVTIGSLTTITVLPGTIPDEPFITAIPTDPGNSDNNSGINCCK